MTSPGRRSSRPASPRSTPPPAAKSAVYAVPMCKGVQVRMARAYVDELLGPGAFARIAVSVDVTWRLPILVSSSYDADGLLRILAQVQKETGASVTSITTALGRRNAEHDLRHVYKIVERFEGAERVLAMFPSLWRNYFNYGKLEVVANARGRARLRIDEIPTRLAGYAHDGFRGFLPAAIETAGGKNVKLKPIEIVPRPADECVTLFFEVTYEG